MAELGEALPAIEWQHCFPAEKAARCLTYVGGCQIRTTLI